MKAFALVALVLAAIIPLPVAADDALVRFKGGIGVHPVSNVSGTANVDGSFPNVTRNVVRGINPAGQLWVIADLKAAVKTDGSIKVDGRGLLLAGGNGIGTNANARVFATLICEAATPFVERSTDRSGLGLGLSISRKAVQLNGGEIRVRNLPGTGCIFTVEMPRALGANANRECLARAE